MRTRTPRAHAPRTRGVPAAERAARPEAGRWFPWALLAALGAAALVHAPALRGFFSGDDITFLLRARGLEPTPWAFRPLSESLAFRTGLALFGLNPRGFLLANAALHLANALWVGLIGARLTRSRAAGAAAAVLFGATSIAFTPLHWAAGVVELLTAQLALAGTWLWLEARERGRAGAMWVPAACGFAAACAKETAVVWPLALAAIEWRAGLFRPRARSLVGPLAAAALWVAVFLVSGQPGRFAGSEAYRRTLEPGFLAANLCTYLSWVVAVMVPMRDAVAAADPRAWRVGLPLALVVGAGLVAARRARPRVAEVGMAWFLAFLLPVLPLAHHTYLYYVYLPWAGVCWAVVASGRVLGRLAPRVAVPAAVVLLMIFVALEARNVRIRQAESVAGLPRDRTVREALLLGRATAALRAAHLTRGTAVGFVNPLPLAHASLTGAKAAGGTTTSYIPLAAALRGDEAVRLFLPGVHSLGFASGIPPAWGDAEIFLYAGSGELQLWGRGQGALRHLAEWQLAAQQWSAAAVTFARVRALGDTLPGVVYGEMAALDAAGRAAEADRLAADFVRRWPGHPLAAEVRAVLARPGGR